MRDRHLQIIGIKADFKDEYLRLHDQVWPEVQARLRASNIENYSIFIHGELLLGYFEYIGTDYAADMSAMAADPATQQWWLLTDPCQQPLPAALAAGTMWEEATEIWHLHEKTVHTQP